MSSGCWGNDQCSRQRSWHKVQHDQLWGCGGVLLIQQYRLLCRPPGTRGMPLPLEPHECISAFLPLFEQEYCLECLMPGRADAHYLSRWMCIQHAVGPSGEPRSLIELQPAFRICMWMDKACRDCQPAFKFLLNFCRRRSPAFVDMQG